MVFDNGRPFYGRFADAYDRVITDPVEPWVDVVQERLLAAGKPRAAVLDAGCGTGRHAAALIGRGFRVDLLDASPELLRQAVARCPGARALSADLCVVAPAAEYDAVTCRGVLNDLVTDADRDAAIGALGGFLRPGGLLFLDVREADASRRRADGSWRHRAGFSSRTTWRDGLLWVEERYEAGVSHEFAMRPWSRPELIDVLGRHGFRDIVVGAGVGRRTRDRVLVVAGTGFG